MRANSLVIFFTGVAIMEMKILLGLGLIGHILCGYTDCLLAYSKSGRLNLKNLKDNEKMSEMFKDYPINNALYSMLLGVLAIAVFVFGYLGLAKWMAEFSHTLSLIMYVSAVACLIVLVSHHVFCGVVYWFYVRLGRTNEAREVVLEFFKKTSITMIAGYVLLAVFIITFFVAVVSGITMLPQWACVFNMLPVMLIIAPTKLPAKGNIAGAVMFLGLLFLI